MSGYRSRLKACYAEQGIEEPWVKFCLIGEPEKLGVSLVLNSSVVVLPKKYVTEPTSTSILQPIVQTARLA